MAKVLGFTIEIQGTKTAIDTTNQLKEALKKINEEMGKTSDKALFETMQKEAAKLKAELNGINKEQQNFVRQMEAAKTGKGSYVELNAELVKLRQNYKAMSAEERASPIGKETIKSIGQLDKELKKIDASMGQFQRNVGNYPQTILGMLGQLSPALGNLGNTISNIGSASGIAGKALIGGFAIASLVPQLVSAAAATEQYRVSFQTLSGSVEEGNKLFEKLIDFAKNTPFELPQLQDAAKSLTAFGFDTQGVMDTLQTLGDISAGVGQEKLPQLVAALGKVRAAGRLTGETLQSFVDAGVPLLQTLADKSGVSTRQLQKNISEGKISFQETQAALESMTKQGGKFFGLMENQSKTTAGQLSNFKDTIGQLASNLGGLLLPAVNAIVGGLGQIVSSITNMISPTKSAVENTADLQTQFNIEVETLKRANLSQENRKALIDGINERYKTYLPSLITEKDTIEQIGIKQAEANKAFEQKMILLAAEKSFVDINQKRLDAQKQELELAKKLTAEEQKFAEATERTRKRGTFDRNETGAFLDLQASEALIKAQQNVQENKVLQEQLRAEYIKTEEAAKKLGLDLSKITGGGTPGGGGGGGGDDKDKNKREAAGKAANEAILREREAFEKQLRELVNTARDLTIGIIEDKYKKEQELALKRLDDQLQQLKDARAKLVKEQGDTEEKLIEAQKLGVKGSTEQLAQFRATAAKQLSDFDAASSAAALKAEEEKNRKFAEIEKTRQKDIVEAQKKTNDISLKNLEEYYKEQELTIETANTNILNKIDEHYQNLLDNDNLTAKQRLQIQAQYNEERYQAQVNAINEEIALLRTKKAVLDEVDPTSAKALEKQIADLEAQLSKLAKTRKTNQEKTNKEISDIDKKDNEERVRRAQEALGLIQDFASQVASFIDELNQQQLDKMDEQINKHKDLISSLEDQMSNTTGAQRVELQRQIDAEKAALEQSTINRANAEKQAAKEHQRIALLQAIIDTAAAVISNLKTPPVPFAAIAAGVTGAIQTGIIASQAFAQGGKVLSGEKIRSRPNIKMRNGDNVLATVRTGEVILNERQQAMLGGSRTFKRIGVPGFADGGFTGAPLPRPADYFMDAQTAGMPTNNEFKALIRSIDARFDRMQVTVVGEDVQNELNNQARAKKAAVI